MANPIPVNTDLASTFWVPIVAIQIQLGTTGTNLLGYFNRWLVQGHKQSQGTALLNVPYRITQLSDANNFFGPQSEVAVQYAHFQAQMQAMNGTGAEVWGIAVPAPSGASATHLITILDAIDPTTGSPFIDPATGVASVKAQSAGYIDTYIAGWKFTSPVNLGDSFSTLCAAIATEINNRIGALNAPWNCPILSAVASGATLTITANHVGLIGNDLPIKVNFSSPNLRLAASPGTVLFSGTAGAAGSCSLVAGSLTCVAAINNANTASQSSAALAAAVLAGNFNVSAFDNSVNTAGQTILYYVQDRVCHRVSVSLTTVTTQTVAASVGTAGSGAPGSTGLSAALSACRTLGPCRIWNNPWVDTATVQALYQEIESRAGISQADQEVFMGSTDSLTNAAALVTTPAPSLTTSPRYSIAWCADDEIRGVDSAARCAALCIASSQPNDNWDGALFQTTGLVPLGAPNIAVRPDPISTCNTAIYSSHLTPIVVNDSGQKVIMRGTTTVVAADDSLSNWGVIFGLGFARQFARQFLQGRFPRKLLKHVGLPQGPKSITPAVVGDAMGEILDCLEQGSAATPDHPSCPSDIIDGADSLKKLIQFQSNPQVSGRVDVTFPTRITPPLHQIGVVEQQVGG